MRKRKKRPEIRNRFVSDTENSKAPAVWLIEKNVKTPVPVDKLKDVARIAFRVTGRRPGEISIVVCNDAFIAGLNREYRRKNRPTDVLSFPMGENESGSDSNLVLGDIIISVQTAEAQAIEEGKTLEDEFVFLFIHGLLHLLGYTHDHRSDDKTMMGMTSEILAGIKGTI